LPRIKPYRGRLVGGIVIDDQVQGEIGQSMVVDLLKKAQGLAGAMARHARPDHLAVKHVQRCEQSRRAVLLVVVGRCAGPSDLPLDFRTVE